MSRKVAEKFSTATLFFYLHPTLPEMMPHIGLSKLRFAEGLVHLKVRIRDITPIDPYSIFFLFRVDRLRCRVI